MIEQLQKDIHKNSIEKGFWEGEAANIPTKLMLIVSEVAEAMEAHRNNKFYNAEYSLDAINGWTSDFDFNKSFEEHVKDTFEDELADAVIRIFDLAEKMSTDLEGHIKAKMRYNTMRAHKHGVAY